MPSVIDEAFDTYTRSIDNLMTIGLPREERIRAAWLAGGGEGPVPGLVSPSPYLYDQMREAFNLSHSTKPVS